MLLKKIKQNRETVGFGIALSLLLLLNGFLEFKLLILSHQYEIYIGVIAVLFTLIGIWVAQKITTPKTVIVEKEVYISNPTSFVFNQAEIDKRKISKREVEVLELMAAGLSNQEIANRLFVSLNTIKTHSSNLFEKLEVKRRTQAIEMAKKLHLIS
ncbi:MAG: LuxR C-terminal-related transcriptional regulator [Bacteroidota bacterium]